LEFTGSFATHAPGEIVAAKLADIEFISQCLPSLGKLEVISPDEFFASFKVDLGDVTAKMHLDYLSKLTIRMHFNYLQKSIESIILEGNGRVVGSKLDLNLQLGIREMKGVSTVAWTAQAEFGKLLKLFGESLIREVSTGIINDVTDCLKSKLVTS